MFRKAIHWIKVHVAYSRIRSSIQIWSEKVTEFPTTSKTNHGRPIFLLFVQQHRTLVKSSYCHITYKDTQIVSKKIQGIPGKSTVATGTQTT